MGKKIVKYQSGAWLLTVALILFGLLTGTTALQAKPADDEGPAWRGTLEARPSAGTIGNWTIAGRVFSADNGTTVDQEHGTLQVGGCVEVKYQVVASGYRAVKLESKEATDCNGGGDDDGDGNNEAYGQIDSMPTGNREGDWTIAGVVYRADSSTQFEQEHGGFAVGSCVKLEIRNGTPLLLTKIEVEQAYKCNNSGDGQPTNPTGEVYGVISSYPAGLIGEWTVGTMTFVTDGSTQFAQNHNPFASGVLVEVNFYTDSGGVHHATKIESKYATDEDGHDDDGNGSYEGHEGHAYGNVEVMPAGGQSGAWTIAGLPYQADGATRFEQEAGPLGVGVNVKVTYYLDANQQRIVTKIEPTDETGGTTDPSHAKFYGFVQQLPNASFNGQWLINGVTLSADNQTLFQENHGLLVVGAYVEVEYAQRTDGAYLVKIETQVPPGAGTNTRSGTIESNSVNAANQQQGAAAWIVAGQTFLVTPATDLNTINGQLAVGERAIVNSYTDANGQQVATQIRGVVFTTTVFLPMTVR